MAGDWIKMRMDLPEDPAVYRLARLTGLDRLSVVGRLYAFWAWADKHAVDGRVDGGAAADVDDVVRHDGFAEAMASVKWLEIGADCLTIPKHDRHNSESAKERSLKNQRQARWRGKQDGSETVSPSTPASTKPSTREEKRREDTKPPKSPKGEPEGFAEWYAAYPRKDGRAPAVKAFAKVTAPLSTLLAALAWQRRLPGWTKDGGQFVPLPATYLNNERWNDQRPAQADETEWFATRSGVEGKAREMGLRPWIELEEQWPTFKQRVMQAVKDLDAPAISFDQLQQLAAARTGVRQ